MRCQGKHRNGGATRSKPYTYEMRVARQSSCATLAPRHARGLSREWSYYLLVAYLRSAAGVPLTANTSVFRRQRVRRRCRCRFRRGQHVRYGHGARDRGKRCRAAELRHAEPVQHDFVQDLHPVHAAGVEAPAAVLIQARRSWAPLQNILRFINRGFCLTLPPPS